MLVVVTDGTGTPGRVMYGGDKIDDIVAPALLTGGGMLHIRL